MKVQKLFFEHLSTLYCLPILLEPKILFKKEKRKHPFSNSFSLENLANCKPKKY